MGLRSEVPEYRDWPTKKREFTVPGKPLLDLDTPVMTIGSCFAEYFMLFLDKYDFNILDSHCGYKYSTSSILREVKNAFDGKLTTPEHICKGGKGYTDLNHHRVYDQDKNRVLEKINRIELCMQRMLPKAKVLILTLGQNEVWKNLRTNELILHPYPQALGAETELEVHFMSVEQNKEQLEEIHQLLAKNIPDLEIILCVCPISLRRTYQNMDAIQGNNLSKYTLYAAANEFAEKHKNVHYFPGFDIVGYECPGYEHYESDGRHLKNDGIEKFLGHFTESFCTEKARKIIFYLNQFSRATGKNKAEILKKLSETGYPTSLFELKKAELLWQDREYLHAYALLESIEDSGNSPAIQYNLGLLSAILGNKNSFEEHMKKVLFLLSDLEEIAFSGATRENKILYGGNHMKLMSNYFQTRLETMSTLKQAAENALQKKEMAFQERGLSFMGN